MGNPLQTPLDVLFGRITALNGALRVIEAQSRIALDTLKRHKSSDATALPDIWHGSRVLLEDIGDFPDDGWRRFKATAHAFVVRTEDAETAAGEILELIALFAVAQAYEAFETFLFDSVACLHCAKPSTADKRKQAEWAKKCGSPSTREQYRQYARDSYRGRNNAEVLSLIRSLARQVRQVEERNTLATDLRDWLEVASEVRHAATHSSGVLGKERRRRLSRQQEGVLRDWFPGEDRPDGYVLHLDTKSTERALMTFHNYAYAVHKSLSIEHGFRPAYTDEDAG
jgi:hypothetical protein